MTAAAGGLVAAGGLELAARAIEARTPSVARWHDAVATHKYARAQSLRAHGVDVLFGGTSQVLVGIDPVHATPAGQRSYNAALHRAVPTVSRRWLLEFIVPLLRPSVVVLGASLLDLNDHGRFHHDVYARFAAAADLVGRVPRRPASVRLAARLRRPRRLLRDLVRRPDELPQTRATSFLREDGFSEEFVAKGYLVSEKKQAMLTDEIAAGFQQGGEQIAALGSLVAGLREQCTTVLLCELPVRPEFVDLFPGGSSDLATASRFLRQTAADHGVPFLSLSGVQDKVWFADPIHLNGEGAAHVSRAIRSAIGGLSREG